MTQQLQVGAFDPVRWKPYKDTVQPESTLGSLWPDKARPGSFEGGTVGDVSFDDYSWRAKTRLALLAAPTNTPTDPQAYVLVIGDKAVATMETKATKKGKAYLTGTPGYDMEVAPGVVFNGGTRFNAWAPFPGGNADLKGAAWTLKITGLSRPATQQQAAPQPTNANGTPPAMATGMPIGTPPAPQPAFAAQVANAVQAPAAPVAAPAAPQAAPIPEFAPPTQPSEEHIPF